MPIPLECKCGRSMRVKDELAGKQGKCPACGTLLRIPRRKQESEDEAASYLLAGSPIREKSRVRRPSREDTEPEPEPDPPRRPRSRREPERIEEAPRVARDIRKKPRARKERERSGVAFEEGWFGSTNAGMVGGVLMMLIAVVWFVAGIALIDRIFFYPPILFVLGIIAFFKGLAGGE